MRWERPQSPPGVERVRDDKGTVYTHNVPYGDMQFNDDRWTPEGGHVHWTWAQLLSNVEWLEEA